MNTSVKSFFDNLKEDKIRKTSTDITIHMLVYERYNDATPTSDIRNGSDNRQRSSDGLQQWVLLQ